MNNWFWWMMAAIVLIAIVVAMFRRQRNIPRPGLYDSAMPKRGTPESTTRTIPRRATSVAPGTLFPIQQVVVTPDSDD